MTAVECSAKSGPYCRHVSAGLFASEALTGKNTSVGLRTTCTIQFTDAQIATSRIAEAMMRTAQGAPRSATSARPVRCQAPERCVRWRRVRVARSRACEIVADGITAYLSSMRWTARFSTLAHLEIVLDDESC